MGRLGQLLCPHHGYTLLPLMFVDETCQLSSGSAQQPLNSGLHGLQALDQVLPMAKPLAEMVSLSGLEEVHQLLHTLLCCRMGCMPIRTLGSLCGHLKYDLSFWKTVYRLASG